MQHAFGFMNYYTCKLEMPTVNQKESIQNTLSFNVLYVSTNQWVFDEGKLSKKKKKRKKEN